MKYGRSNSGRRRECPWVVRQLSTNVRTGGARDLLSSAVAFVTALPVFTGNRGSAGRNHRSRLAGQATGEAPTLCQEGLYEATSERGEVAGVSPGPSTFSWPRIGVRWDERGVADATSVPRPVRK